MTEIITITVIIVGILLILIVGIFEFLGLWHK